MTFDEVLKLATVIVVILSTCINVFMFMKTRADERFKTIDSRLTGLAEQRRASQELTTSHSSRIAAIEARLQGLPTHGDLSGIRSELSAVAERTETTYEIVRSLQDFLMKGGKS